MSVVHVNDWFNPAWGGGFNATFSYTLRPEDVRGGFVAAWQLAPTYSGAGTVSAAWMNGFQGQVSSGPGGALSTVGQSAQAELQAGDTLTFTLHVVGAAFDPDDFLFAFTDLDPVPDGVAPGDSDHAGWKVYGDGDDRIFAEDATSWIDAGDGDNEIHTGDGDDRIRSGSGNDRIFARDGDNEIEAGDGDNEVHAAAGDDVIVTGDGNDRIYAGGGRDEIDAGDGRNEVYAGSGDDVIVTGGGNDRIYAGGGRNEIDAGDGRNEIHSGSGDDIVVAGSGSDMIFTQGGNDVVDAGGGGDIVHLGGGDDTLTFLWSEANGARNVFWGASGIDTFRVVLTAAEARDGAVLADLAGLQDQLAGNAGWKHDFASFDSSVRQFEALDIVAPVEANGDATSTDEDTAVSIDVIANDVDLLGDVANLADDNARLAITEIDVSALPGDAAAWSDDDRTITFDPGTAFQSLAQDETTSIEIAYTVSDDQGFSDDAVLTVTVTGVNDDPTLAAGVLAANEDGAPVELDLSTLGDDVDGDDDGATLAYAVTGAPAEGSASISGTTLTFGPGADFQDLAEGETRDVTIELTATDRHGATAVNDVTVTVTGVNDDPTLTAGVLAASEDGAPVELDLSTLGDDVDGDDDGATLAYAVTGGPAEGSASISGTTLTFDPGADFQDLAAGETRDVTVQVTATDKHGATAVNGVVVTVTGTNDAPIAQDVELVANVTGNSTFENGFDGWTQVSTPQTGPNGERIASDYSYSFRIDQSQSLIPGDGHVADIAFSGWLAQYRDGPNRGTVYGPSLLSDPFAGSAGDIVTFEYRAFSGGDAASITAELVNVDTGAVTPVFFEQTPAGQTSPVRQIEVPISQAGNYRIEFTVGSFDQSDGGFVGARLAIGTAGIVRSGVAEGDVQVFEALQFTRDATDVDNGAIITLEGTDAVSALGAAVSIDGDGNVRYDAAAVTALAAHETAIDTFDFTVSDEHGATGTATASIRLVGRNDDPTMAAGALAASEDGAPVELDLAALGEDVDSDDDGTTLSYAVTSGPAEGSASITDTTLTFDPGADFQELAEGETRAVTVQVTATDRHGATAVNDVTVTVTGVNDGPMANDDGPFTVAEDGTVRIAFTDLLANDMDVDGDALTIDSFDFGNTAGKVTDNGDGTLTYDPNGAFDSLNTGDTGADSFTYRVTDGNGGTAEAAVALSIEGNGPVGTVLGFDDLGGGSVPDGYGGLNWHNARVLDPSNEYPDSGYLRGITSGDYVAYNSFAREMNVSHASGDEFDFLGATLTAAWNDNLNVEITGFRDGQQVEFERVVVSDDEPTEFLLNWRDVDALRFVSYGGTDAGTIGTGTHFAMDDFIIA